MLVTLLNSHTSAATCRVHAMYLQLGHQWVPEHHGAVERITVELLPCDTGVPQKHTLFVSSLGLKENTNLEIQIFFPEMCEFTVSTNSVKTNYNVP